MRTQKGSLMIEIIAVLGLIALITPVLFRQIARRNEDIVAMQVASEMRAVKDALAAYIQAYEQTIAETCDLTDEGGNYVYLGDDDDVYMCDEYNRRPKYDDTEDLIREQVGTFFAGNADAFNDYGWGIYGYTVPAKKEGDEVVYRPVLYGVVYQGVSEETLRMASKIAGLIGLDGGVVTDESETALGVQGAWDLDLRGIIEDGSIPKNTVVAVTSFDDATNTAILKDVKLENFVGETMQATMSTSSRMAVSDLLSVGGENCIIDAQNPTVQVVGWGENGPIVNTVQQICAPFFEVNAADGVVRLAGVLTGEEIGKGNCADLEKDDCEAAAYCTWDAKAKVGEDDTGVCEARHKIDLSAEGISSMHDIKLTSRGGAKLSDLLPTYSLKGFETIINNTTTTTAATVGDFDCGIGTQALIVVPTKVTATTSESEELAHTHTVTVTMTHEPVEGSLNVTLGSDIKEAIVYKYCVFENGTTTTPAN